VLCRDVTEVRRRERELVGKDTAIREIHHRVKNNLQTVAALLRLQSRRLGDDDETAREALTEAERRIGSIAVVHETLARAAEDVVDFDEVADRVAGMVGALGAAGEVRVRRDGSFGLLEPEVATPLALVLVELVQNAVEHGLAESGGEVVVTVRPEERVLRLSVEDGGRGLPPGFDLDRDAGLGLQIVRTLVEGELGGRLLLDQPTTSEGARGTRAEVVLPRG
jgi:two-component sensor histidine kinase